MPTSQATSLKNGLYWLIYLILVLASGSLAALLPPPWPRLCVGILACGGIYLVTVWFLKWDTKSLSDGGLVMESGTVFRFLQGIGLGSLVVPLTIAVLLGIGKAQLTPNPQVDWGLLGLSLVALVFHALHEEIAFRSYPIQTLQPRFGLWGSQLIIALAFGAYHVANGWSIPNALIGTCTWSFVFGLSAVLSRGIALPTGIHTAINVGHTLFGSQGLWVLSPLNTSDRQFHYLGEGIRLLMVLVWVVVLFRLIRNRQRTNSGAVPALP